MKLRDEPIHLTRLVICRAGIGILGLLLGLFPCLTVAQENTLVISVVDVDLGGVPVPSIVVKLPPSDGAPQGETDEKGELSLQMACSQGTRIQARPISDAYEYSREVFCKNRSEINFKVTSIRVASKLQANFTASVAAEDFATAAHVANELSWLNLRSGEGVAGTEAERFAYIYAAQTLGAGESFVFDSMQGKDVMAPVLWESVSKFQSTRDTMVTGQLDYRTLPSAVGKNQRCTPTQQILTRFAT